MHLLLQVLEEGTITDSFGRKIDFRNTIIIMTSNVGAELIKKQSIMGFGAIGTDKHDFSSMKEKIEEQAKKHFKPEFLNRLDDLIVFHMLEKEDLVKIVDLEISKVLKRVRDKKIEVELDQSSKELLIAEGYDPAYGARPMRRAVERFLEDPFAEHLLRGDIKEGDHVSITRRENEKSLKFSVREETPPAAEEAVAGVAE